MDKQMQMDRKQVAQTFIIFFLFFMAIVVIVIGNLAIQPVIVEGHGQVSNVFMPFFNISVGNLEGDLHIRVPAYMLWNSGWVNK